MKTRMVFVTVLGISILLLTAYLSSPSATAGGRLAGVKVCIDPGHGGEDPGAVNAVYGLKESDINLDVSQALATLLAEDGATAVLTRDEDVYRTNADRYTFCNEQGADILVSVHTNSVIDPTWDGSMTLYAPSAEKTLAVAMHDVMYEFLRDTAPANVTFRDFGLDNFASGVLFKCDMPAAMVEPLFMSNPSEAALLVPTTSDEPCADLSCRRGDVVHAIRLGILNYYGGVGPPPEREGVMHVESIDMDYSKRGRRIFVSTTVTVRDEIGKPVSGATVAVETVSPLGAAVNSTGTTGEDGRVTFTLRFSQIGTYTSTVKDVTKADWLYDANANVEDSETLPVR